jgi:hypothetical protein
MSKVKHTPGPWEARFEDGVWVQPPNPSDPIICDLLPRDADSYTLEDEANAYLIAAAPDLMAACELAYSGFGFPIDDESHIKISNALAAAIRKAKGGDQ